MEYSFIHHRGTLWTDSGPREPDGQLWHATLPMHPSDPTERILLESAVHKATSTSVIELAALLLDSEPVQEAGDSPSGSRPQRALSGSVAQLTFGLDSVIASENVQGTLRGLLERSIHGVQDPGWVELSDSGETSKPWIVRGAALPPNMNRIPQRFASKEAAERGARRMREEARFAVISAQIGLPQVRMRALLEEQKPFQLIEALQVASAFRLSPLDALGLR
jgi:hypothetical protein